MKKRPIAFDRERMSVSFMDIQIDYKTRYVGGEKQEFPYKLFDSPWLKSDYGSGIYHVTDGTQTAVYDFNL